MENIWRRYSHQPERIRTGSTNPLRRPRCFPRKNEKPTDFQFQPGQEVMLIPVFLMLKIPTFLKGYNQTFPKSSSKGN